LHVSKKTILLENKQVSTYHCMIIALANQKGGVGKSTIAVHLAVWLKDGGARVAMVDSDAQSSSTQWLKEAAPDIPLFRLATADDILDQLPKIQEGFDHLVIDAPGSLAESTRAILFLTDIALMPCGPSVMDLRAANDAIRVLRQVQGIRKGPPKALFVPNKVQVQYRLGREFMDTAKSLDIPATSPLKLRQAYADAVGQGTVVWKMGRGAKDAADEINQLFKEVFSHDTNSAATSETQHVGSSDGGAGSAAGSP
jgi:chromosome partitioning protein